MPGYVFPLRAVEDGIFVRRGQTEASVDLAEMAGLYPAGVLCEIMSAGGHMMKGDELWEYCQQHSLKIRVSMKYVNTRGLSIIPSSEWEKKKLKIYLS